ncbi:MAG: hypothetical protein QM765_26940 [Myxococcales bacterium]
MRSRAVLLAALALLPGGCATVHETPGLTSKVEGAQMSASELRQRVRALASPFSGQLEYLADQISDQVPNPEVRLRMQRFKTNVIPQVQSALYRPDPLAALVDTWALIVQLQHVLDLISRGGPLADPRIDALARSRFSKMERQLEQLWQQLSGRQDTSLQRAQVHDWAAQHPIVGSIDARDSTAPLLAGLAREANLSIGGAAGRLLVTAEDLAQFVDLQAAYQPKQARWQGELMLRELFDDPTLGSPREQLAALGALVRTAQGLPGLMAAESRSALSDLNSQRLDAQGFLSAQRTASFADAQQVGNVWIDRSFDRLDHLVDRAFAWLLAVVGLLVAGAVAVTWLIARARRPVPPHGAPAFARPATAER